MLDTTVCAVSKNTVLQQRLCCLQCYCFRQFFDNTDRLWCVQGYCFCDTDCAVCMVAILLIFKVLAVLFPGLLADEVNYSSRCIFNPYRERNVIYQTEFKPICFSQISKEHLTVKLTAAF